MMGGAPSSEQLAMAKTQEMVNQVQAELEEKENWKFTTFNAVSYKNQVVAGTSYFIKVDVGDEKFLHLKLFKPLPHEGQPLSLTVYQTKKTKEDHLVYF